MKFIFSLLNQRAFCCLIFGQLFAISGLFSSCVFAQESDLVEGRVCEYCLSSGTHKTSPLQSLKVHLEPPPFVRPSTDSPDLNDVRVPDLTPVTAEQADQLLPLIKRDLNHIDFSIWGAGCESRAHEIAHYLESRGIVAAKIFMEGPGIETRAWKFHVAIAIRVKNNSGHESLAVIDPGFFDRPVSVHDWSAKATVGNEKNIKTYLTNRFTFLPPSQGGIKRSNWDRTELHMACDTNQDERLFYETARTGDLTKYMNTVQTGDWWNGRTPPSYCIN